MCTIRICSFTVDYIGTHEMASLRCRVARQRGLSSRGVTAEAPAAGFRLTGKLAQLELSTLRVGLGAGKALNHCDCSSLVTWIRRGVSSHPSRTLLTSHTRREVHCPERDENVETTGEGGGKEGRWQRTASSYTRLRGLDTWEVPLCS